MFFKATLAAGLVAAALAVAPQAASANTSINIGINGGWGHSGYRCGWANHWCNYPPYGYRPGPVYYGGPIYAPGPARLGCSAGARIVWNHGFNNVQALSCGGPVLVYDATRNGRHWTVRINPWNGRIL